MGDAWRDEDAPGAIEPELVRCELGAPQVDEREEDAARGDVAEVGLTKVVMHAAERAGVRRGHEDLTHLHRLHRAAPELAQGAARVGVRFERPALDSGDGGHQSNTATAGTGRM